HTHLPGDHPYHTHPALRRHARGVAGPTAPDPACEDDGSPCAMIPLGPEICSNLAAATQREWLETNGLGGFASSTVIGLNTRRYHGLLTAALTPSLWVALCCSRSSKKRSSSMANASSCQPTSTLVRCIR